MGVVMALLEDRTAAFIVRVWSERSDSETVAAEWRGSVEHVQSGQRVFFRHLETVVDFMKPHLEGIGIDAQQRFWERVSTVINDAGDQPVALALPSRAPAAAADAGAPSIPARKRR
ncbi:hypothetical protein C9I47_1972 [Lysobacter maris]|uniref:Uncharacterized protein n=2 Tax=Marilutibacter maris TaxID=1605891 RepID=A0A2U9TDK5_9GAMM|nr:hypothetical protein C9I47_1972 [Lysobacter maris]